MAALDDVYRSFAFGQQLGQGAKENRLAREQKQFENRLAPLLSEGDYAGAAQESFKSGRLEAGMGFQDRARALAKADREAAMAEGEQFAEGYGKIVDFLGKVDAARSRGVIDDQQHMAALETGLSQFGPMIEQNPKLAEVVPGLLQTYFSAPPGSAAVYNEEFFKSGIKETEPSKVASERREEEKLALDRRRTAAREAEVAAKEREVGAYEKSLAETFPSLEGGGGETDTGAPTVSAPSRQEFFDPIGAASGPVSATKAAVRAVPGVGGATEFGKQERESNQRIRALGKDLLRIYTTNSSRVSNFDLQQTQKIFGGSGPFKSAAALTDDISEARRIAGNNYEALAAAAQNPNLEKSVRSNAQDGALGLKKIIDEMDDILLRRKISTTDIGGKPVTELTDEDIMSALQAGSLTPEEKAVILEYRRNYK